MYVSKRFVIYISFINDFQSLCFQKYFFVLENFPANFYHSMFLIAKLSTKESEDKHSHDHGHTHEHLSSPGNFSTRDKPLYRTDFDKVQNIISIHKICLKAEKLANNFVRKNMLLSCDYCLWVTENY